jgi:hypothetical protein
MRRLGWIIFASAAIVASCKREPAPRDLCDHFAKLGGAAQTEVQIEHCVTEMANAKSTSQKEYTCFAPCALKAATEADVDDCKFTCAGDKESPSSVCRRLLILRGGRALESSCVARYTTMQSTSPAQFDCAASCVRKSTSRADVESCLAACPTQAR